MNRDYQYNYSELHPSVFNSDKRIRKVDPFVRICQDFIGTEELSKLHLPDVGSSSGIIDNYLADYFAHVTGIDIDAPAMAHTRKTFCKSNLNFEQGDAMQIDQSDDSFDVVVCTQIYEHVPDASRMFNEIFRVLKPRVFCYFSGCNRVILMEPHYNLPWLSMLPRVWAHRYVRTMGKGDYYHELHFSYRTLQKLYSKFHIENYSARVVAEPDRFGIGYMLRMESVKWMAAKFVARHMPWATPAMWILQKPLA